MEWRQRHTYKIFLSPQGGCPSRSCLIHANSRHITGRALDILSGGIETTVQDFPGRLLDMGIPRSGPMDFLSFRIANLLVGNPEGTEGLEITLPASGCRMFFHIMATVCVTGADARVTIDGKDVPMWAKLIIQPKSKLAIGKPTNDTTKGMRTYLAIKGGFPEVPLYLGSKSTSMGLGGYQVRSCGSDISLLKWACRDACLEQGIRLRFDPTA
jgi:urea carboxylase